MRYSAELPNVQCLNKAKPAPIIEQNLYFVQLWGSGEQWASMDFPIVKW